MGVDAQGFPGGLLRLDPAFVYGEPPSSWPLPRAECLTLAPNKCELSAPLPWDTLFQDLICTRQPCPTIFLFFSVSGFLVPGASLIQFLLEISYQWLRCWRGSDIKPDVDFNQSTCFSLLPYCYLLWPLVSTIPDLLWYLLLLFIFLYRYLSLTFCFAKLLSTDIFVTWSYTYLLVQRKRSLCFYFLFSLL